MRRIAAGLALTVALLSGCGGGYSPGDAAALYEKEYGARNVRCKHLEQDPGDIFRCHAHRTGGPAAGMKIRVDDGSVEVESCAVVHWRPHPPPGYRPPCEGIGIPWQGLQVN
jgi:hypothetical protein